MTFWDLNYTNQHSLNTQVKDQAATTEILRHLRISSSPGTKTAEKRASPANSRKRKGTGSSHGGVVVGHGGERRLLLRWHGEGSIASPGTKWSPPESVPRIKPPCPSKGPEETLVSSINLPFYPSPSHGYRMQSSWAEQGRHAHGILVIFCQRMDYADLCRKQFVV